MPDTELVTRGSVLENSSLTLTSRIRKLDASGTPIVPADVTSIHLKCWDITDKANPILVVPTGGGGSYAYTDLDPEDVILDALDTGYVADDEEGFNFRVDLDGSYVPNGGHTYRLEFLLTPSGDAQPYYRVFEVEATEVYSA